MNSERTTCRRSVRRGGGGDGCRGAGARAVHEALALRMPLEQVVDEAQDALDAVARRVQRETGQSLGERGHQILRQKSTCT